ncbi:MAG: ribosome rescue protein RqcH, partial [Halobacteria archaeon]|nr:ribosome rescue protein RqcH [Halobacteria archaeon]
DPDDAPESPPDLPMLMRKRLSGGDLTRVEQYDFDRVVEIHGARSEDETYTIVVELFGDGNVSFLDSDGKVLRSLNTVRLSTRTVAPGEEYEHPPSRIDPTDLDYEDFVETMEDSDTDYVRTLASRFNFGGLYAEEICMRAGVEKETSIDEADEDDYRAIYDALRELVETLDDGDLSPRIVRDGDEPVDVVPLELRSYDDHDVEEFDSFNRALDLYFEEVEDHRAESETDDGGLEAEIRKQESIIEQQRQAIDEFERDEEVLRAKAEALYANYGVVDDLLETVREARSDGYSWDEIRRKLEEAEERGIESASVLDSVDGDEGTLYVELACEVGDTDEESVETVRLDVDEGVEANASRLYDEAKEVAEKREGALEAVEERKEKLRELREERERDEVDGGDDDGDADDDEGEATSLVPRGEMWYERFRWFRTSDGYLVIGGRNADQNEEINSKYMESHDLFFHTQAEGGPITVLKATEPDESVPDEVDIPETSKREAAQFAASYSSLWEAGQYSAEVYSASPDQVSKTPESGEYIRKGSVVVRGERRYYDVALRVAVGLRLDDEAGVVGGPPNAVRSYAEHCVELEPGEYNPNDTAKKIYRRFRDEFDESLVRSLTSTDEIRRYLPPGGSRFRD